MTERTHEPGGALERLFHEPNRLAILSALCTARDGLSFTDLRGASQTLVNMGNMEPFLRQARI